MFRQNRGYGHRSPAWDYGAAPMPFRACGGSAGAGRYTVLDFVQQHFWRVNVNSMMLAARCRVPPRFICTTAWRRSLAEARSPRLRSHDISHSLLHTFFRRQGLPRDGLSPEQLLSSRADDAARSAPEAYAHSPSRRACARWLMIPVITPTTCDVVRRRFSARRKVGIAGVTTLITTAGAFLTRPTILHITRAVSRR